MSKYLGLVLECRNRPGGDIETFICAEYEPANQRYTLIPTRGRLCRQHLVKLNSGGWEVVGSRKDLPLLRQTIDKLKSFIRSLNADQFALPSQGAVAQRNICLIERILSQESAVQDSPTQPAPKTNSLANVMSKLATISMFQSLLEKVKLCGKFVFIEFPIDDPDRDHGGEYFVVEHTADRLYCIATADAVMGCNLAQIKIFSENRDEPTARVIRSYDDPQYAEKFAAKLERLSSDDSSDPIVRDRAENAAAQMRRVLKRIYPAAGLATLFDTNAATGRSESQPRDPFLDLFNLMPESPLAGIPQSDEQYRPSDAVLPL